MCLALAYTVLPNGTTGDFKVLRAWSSSPANAMASEKYLDSFSQAAANAVSQWRFEPKDPSAQSTVRTVATMLFHGGRQTPKLRDHCAVKDLAGYERGLAAGRRVDQAIHQDYTKAQRRMLDGAVDRANARKIRARAAQGRP